MAGLSTLIRLHRHELDEKRRALGELYSEMAVLERRRRALERMYETEKQAVDASGDVHFTFMQFTEKVKKERAAIEKEEAGLERLIEAARDSLMETFAEIKKYEMTEDERARLEEEEQKARESRAFDEIGLEGFRRRREEEEE